MREAKQNPYLSDSREPLLRESVVAFIDILGYQGQVVRAYETGSALALLKALRKALDQTYQMIEDQSGRVLPSLGTRAYWAVKCFTDNIVIGYPIRDDAEVELGTTISNLAYFQLSMIHNGFFVRGGISIGELYIDDEIVFGQGLSEAYEAESKLARDPRVVLSASASKYLSSHMRYYARPEDSPQNLVALKDRDGQLFVNYLYPIIEFEGDCFVGEDELLRHKGIVETKMKEHISEPTIWSKYFWAANYHNWFCEQNRRHFNESFDIKLADVHIGPSWIKEGKKRARKVPHKEFEP